MSGKPIGDVTEAYYYLQHHATTDAGLSEADSVSLHCMNISYIFPLCTRRYKIPATASSKGGGRKKKVVLTPFRTVVEVNPRRFHLLYFFFFFFFFF